LLLLYHHVLAGALVLVAAGGLITICLGAGAAALDITVAFSHLRKLSLIVSNSVFSELSCELLIVFVTSLFCVEVFDVPL
jgi:hypothetical protein